MKQAIFLFPVVLSLLAAQDPIPVAITSPVANQVLNGQVNIIGSTAVTEFVSAELEFAYASSPVDTWFPLETLSQPVFDSPLYTWNTTAITDGNYLLRLRVFVSDGSYQEVTVPVTVQNDVLPATQTPIPTATPEDVMVVLPTPFLLAASPTPTESPRSTPTALPTNPASLQPTSVLLSLGRGALVILGLFVFAGLILRIRRF